MILPVIVPEHVLIFLISGSQYYQLHIIAAEFVHNTLHQIQSLLVGQTGNDSHHEFLFIYRKAKLCLELFFIFSLFLTEIPCIVRLRNELICLRIKLVIVNTIDYTSQISGTCAHQAIKSLPVERHFDFLCVCLADSSDGICKNNASL